MLPKSIWYRERNSSNLFIILIYLKDSPNTCHICNYTRYYIDLVSKTYTMEEQSISGILLARKVVGNCWEVVKNEYVENLLGQSRCITFT